jgi:hypothetical protein
MSNTRRRRPRIPRYDAPLDLEQKRKAAMRVLYTHAECFSELKDKAEELAAAYDDQMDKEEESIDYAGHSASARGLRKMEMETVSSQLGELETTACRIMKHHESALEILSHCSDEMVLPFIEDIMDKAYGREMHKLNSIYHKLRNDTAEGYLLAKDLAPMMNDAQRAYYKGRYKFSELLTNPAESRTVSKFDLKKHHEMVSQILDQAIELASPLTQQFTQQADELLRKAQQYDDGNAPEEKSYRTTRYFAQGIADNLQALKSMLSNANTFAGKNTILESTLHLTDALTSENQRIWETALGNPNNPDGVLAYYFSTKSRDDNPYLMNLAQLFSAGSPYELAHKALLEFQTSQEKLMSAKLQHGR